MSDSIQNIVAILNGYGYGKLFEYKKGKLRRKPGGNDLISISDEAREKLDSDESESRGGQPDEENEEEKEGVIDHDIEYSRNI